MFVYSLTQSFVRFAFFLWVWARWFCDRLHFCYHLSIDLVIYHFCHVDLSHTHTHTHTCRCKDFEFNDRDTFFAGFSLSLPSLSIYLSLHVLQHRQNIAISFSVHTASCPRLFRFWLHLILCCILNFNFSLKIEKWKHAHTIARPRELNDSFVWFCTREQDELIARLFISTCWNEKPCRSRPNAKWQQKKKRSERISIKFHRDL